MYSRKEANERLDQEREAHLATSRDRGRYVKAAARYERALERLCEAYGVADEYRYDVIEAWVPETVRAFDVEKLVRDLETLDAQRNYESARKRLGIDRDD